MDQEKIRNVAIIAHVDHGKTTLVDGLLKQAHVFRENEAAMNQTTILDSHELERERGITILSKNTAINYQGYLINIIDTPGHVDFSGEVERVLNMADGAILLIDAQEGPRPQTRSVLKKALALNLKIIVVINKIDKRAARVAWVLGQTEDLFLDLSTDQKHLDYPVIFAVGREGKSWVEPPKNLEEKADLEPLFKKIIEVVPPPSGRVGEPFQMLVSSLDYDNFRGRYALGRVSRGQVKKGDRLVLLTRGDARSNFIATRILVNLGLKKVEQASAQVGEIILLAGSPDFAIGQTISDPRLPKPLPIMSVADPTLKISLEVNTSPLAGREGRFSTARQLKERIAHELETNISLRLTPTESENRFLLTGRGELHLSVFIESLRRAGYEFQVGKPEVIIKEDDGVKTEPFEEIYIDVPELYSGVVNQEIGRRRGELLKATVEASGQSHLVFKMSTRATLGLRNALLTLSRGTAVISSSLIGFGPLGPNLPKLRNGVLIASQSGRAVTYGLAVAQGRGPTFIDPGTEVYEGMIVGLNAREEDIEINVCKEKKQSNVRSSTADLAVQLTPRAVLSLEQFLNFLEDDELLEITPQNLRPRKKLLSKIDRVRAERRVR